LTNCSRAGGCEVIYPFLTRKERDVETGLDYFLARYYSSTQGRFTSPDEFSNGPRELLAVSEGNSQKPALAYADVFAPQSMNKYQYCLNNPFRYIDPNGHDWRIVEEKDKDGKAVRRYEWDSSYTYKEGDKNGAPANARYIDSQGRAIQLWGDNAKDASKEQTHGYQVVTPEAKGEVAVEKLTNENGEPPVTYVNVGDLHNALTKAGYENWNIDPFHNGDQYFKRKSPTLHIIIGSKQRIVEDNRGGVTSYRTTMDVNRMEFHADRFSQTKDLTKHMKEAFDQWRRQ